MSDDPPTVDEARKRAYKMAFKRFEPMENVAGNQWHELSTRQQRRVIADRLSAWKQGVVFRTVVAPALRSIANQLAESRGNGESTTQTIVNRFETTLFEAFDAGAYDAHLGRDRYASLN
ncbi:hypothetical protein ACFQKF_20455 [Halalkalicoccus sp. GCM10025322]|uniref:hypothetical protein n=1 Tax=Halalkalicoccus TaxID=332246 RepID=UPI002F967F61